MICSVCSGSMWRDYRRPDPAEPMCRDCRRARREQIAAEIARERSGRRPRGAGPRGTTQERGYGRDHQVERRRRLDEMVDGDPCARCGGPMYRHERIDLDHTDDRTGYLGLSHASCNRARRPAEGRVG